MFRKVLIANRGEIALRVIRACRELGISTVAVHSDVDAMALHVRFADEAVCIGPAAAQQSYLNIPSIIAAAEVTGADALHPGYGFLSENAEFAEICTLCGLTFIGPTASDMKRWGDKIQAREMAKKLGLPLNPGTGLLSNVHEAQKEARGVGYPVMLKAAGGGGGRGMKVIRSDEDMARAYPTAQAEAAKAFNNPDLYCEKFVEAPRHVEFQVLADGDGYCAVLGERECSIQRRNQKLVEEAPCTVLTQERREEMCGILKNAMRESGYRSLGTLEFLMDEAGNLAFMEMNTRVQVEHPVTEMVTGVDLITEQIRLAAGEKVSLQVDSFVPRGHAIECRINAEDAVTFAPSPGLITEYHPPGGAGVRVDSGIYGGWRVPGSYDSLLAKVITHGRDREEARARMRRALGEMIVTGIRTNVALHLRILNHPKFASAETTTRFLDNMLSETKTA